MKESHDEGVATNTGPESCGGAREGVAEALTGVRAGRGEHSLDAADLPKHAEYVI
jgi:hypothetical protein